MKDTTSEKLSAQLFDMTCKEVSENITFIQSVNFYTALLSEGMYFVRITDSNGAIVKTQKVVVVK